MNGFDVVEGEEEFERLLRLYDAASWRARNVESVIQKVTDQIQAQLAVGAS